MISIPIVGIVLSISVLLSIAFLVYALNMLHLARRAQNYRPPATAVTSPKPNVAVHLPIYNELYVVRRLIEACCVMAETYGKDLVRICVIDDSDDETREEIDECVSHLSSSGYNIGVLRRGPRVGFKAGALQAALEQTNEGFIAIFDADFSPPADFLDKTVPLMEDKSVGFVQCRWGHIDGKYNLITEALAIGVDAHFLLEQTGRYSSGYMINFSGSAGLLRRDAIIKSGGWNIDTLAEDMDLSYRMQLAGYRPVYLRDFKVPAELPPTITSAKLQQGRWARGSLQNAKKLIPAILRAPSMSKSQKLEAVLHLTYYLINPLMVALFLLAVVAALLKIDVVNHVFDAARSNWLSVGLVNGKAPSNLTFLVFQVVPRAVFSGAIILLPIAVLFYFGKAVRV
ncbi:MAG: glycosyltransferase, partial [Thaumarchaeota archaeon]|nr:glycosyltransferase [Nitrososphaerota archaeon]